MRKQGLQKIGDEGRVTVGICRKHSLDSFATVTQLGHILTPITMLWIQIPVKRLRRLVVWAELVPLNFLCLQS